MNTSENLKSSVLKTNEYKRKFSLRELYGAMVFLPSAAQKLVANRKSKLVDEKFIERLQLAVTEVNGCAACSFQHTKMSLEQGMSNEEIHSFLSGSNEFIVPEEAKAIMFAQHFADTKGKAEKKLYHTIVAEYGSEKAGIILAACQIMLVGNIYGIPFSAFLSRLQGQKYRGSTVFYEFRMLVGGVLILPLALLHGFVRRLMG